MAQDTLTKEAFGKLFPDSFELTGYAIKIAQDQIQAGNEDLNVTDMLNQILKQYPNVPFPQKKVEPKTEENE